MKALIITCLVILAIVLFWAIPPFFIAALTSFYYLDPNLLNPMNWIEEARAGVVAWVGVSTFFMIIIGFYGYYED